MHRTCPQLGITLNLYVIGFCRVATHLIGSYGVCAAEWDPLLATSRALSVNYGCKRIHDAGLHDLPTSVIALDCLS
jgi:hypothetical protein